MTTKKSLLTDKKAFQNLIILKINCIEALADGSLMRKFWFVINHFFLRNFGKSIVPNLKKEWKQLRKAKKKVFFKKKKITQQIIFVCIY